MILGSYTFADDPEEIVGLSGTGLIQQKLAVSQPTLTSSVLFTWSPVLCGTEVVLRWARMNDADWDELQTMAESLSEYTFDPEFAIATPTTMQAVITNLTARNRDPLGMNEVELTLNVRS